MKDIILRHKGLTALAAVLLILALLYGYMRLYYDGIKIRHVPLGFDGDIKIVFAADFQYDMKSRDASSLRHATFQKAIDMINDQHADIILLGGDYITFASNWAAAAGYLRQLEAPLGVYAVFGNHDFRAVDMLAEALPNIRFLRNESVNIAIDGQSLTICGVDDLWTGEPEIPTAGLGEGDFSILLSHNPDFFERLSGQNPFDLSLAGHVHAGQVSAFGWFGFPFVLDTVTDYGEKYRYGEKFYEGSRIYITSGLGGSIFGHPLRFGAQPELVVLE